MSTKLGMTKLAIMVLLFNKPASTNFLSQYLDLDYNEILTVLIMLQEAGEIKYNDGCWEAIK